MNALPLSDDQLEALRRLDACTVANVVETFHQRLRNEGFVDQTVRCLFPELGSVVGYAATLRIRGSAPPTAAGLYPDRTDWWEYVVSLPAPRLLVIEDTATRPGLGSLVGEVHMSVLRALNCIGVATNGAVRDVPAARRAGFHYFAGNLSVSHGYVHVVDFGEPVEIGGLQIRSGELLHGDLHGLQSVPLAIAAQIPAAAALWRAREKVLIDFCSSPEFTLERLRALVAQPPP